MANVGTANSGKTLIGTGRGSSSRFAAIGTLSGLTAHGVVVSEGNGAFVATATGSTGQILQSQGSSADPAYSTATYPSIAGTAGNVITSDGTNFTSTTLPTPPGTTLPNHSVALGTGTINLNSVGPSSTTGQILQSQGSSADPAFSTATYPSTTTVNQILYSSSTNTVTGLATANNGVLTTGATGIPVITQLAADGSLIIGSASGAPVAATLTAGSGISITNGPGSISITATGAGFPWTDTSGTVNAVANNGYFITGTTTSTLPGSPSQGNVVKYIVDTTNILTIKANTGQKIRMANNISATAGTAVNTQQGDAVSLVYRSSSSTWYAEEAYSGAWTIT